MYVSSSLQVARGVQECVEVLKEGPEKWGAFLGKDVGVVQVNLAGLKVGKKVHAEIGEVEETGDWAKVRIAWKATFPSALFPVMEGEVELSPHDKGTTRLTVSGMYEPPLGRVGKWLDDALMHKAAQSTVQEMAKAIAKRLQAA